MQQPIPPEIMAQEVLNQQQIEAQQGMNAPALVQQQQIVQAALVEQTNPAHLLREIDLKLRGFKEQYDGSFKKVSNPLMNEKGISRILFILSSVVNQNTILSHLELEEIGRLIIRIDQDIIDDLVSNWKDYAIPDKMLLDHILDACIIPCFLALKRAWKQNEKNWLNKAVVETINSTPRMSQKKEGFLSKLKL